MKRPFKAYDPDQSFLFPPSPHDWLPEGHLAWFLSDCVEQLDLDAYLKHYRPGGKGSLAYQPRMMLKVLIYAYCVGVFSSRKIARQLEENIAFKVLSGGQLPNHRTICRFREEFLELFENTFVQVIQIAQENGLVKMGTLAIDGSKVKANASKHKAMSYGRMQDEERRLRQEIRALRDRARGEDSEEDTHFGPDFRGDELPKELARREERWQTIHATRMRLEERKAREAQEEGEPSKERSEPPKPEPKDQANFTDPESRIMKTSSGGFEQCYNTQIAVEEHGQLIVAAQVTQSPTDSKTLLSTVDRAVDHTDQVPCRVLADAGYRSEDNFLDLEERGITGYIALGREGKKLPTQRSRAQATARMRRRLQRKHGRQTYKKRKHIVEPVFGWIKQVLGFRAFSVRGFAKVTGEWFLVCLAVNLKRMSGLMAAT